MTFLQRLNTHFVGVAGVLTVVGSTVLTIATKIVDAKTGDSAVSRIALDTANTYFGLPATLVGTAAAYVGRPKSIPPSDAVQVAVAAATGQPAPITPADAAKQ